MISTVWILLSHPATGTPVCGGLSTHQALEIIRGLEGINIVGMDIMEVAPAYDVGEITALAGASMAAEILCLYATNRHRQENEKPSASRSQ